MAPFLGATDNIQTRDRSKQLRRILIDRYRRAPRLEDKLAGGEVKK
jgi:hypothetical protein